MPFQVDQTCYSSALDAVNAMAAREVGSVRQIGSKTYVTDVTATTATSITYVLRDVASTATVTKVATVSPRACGLLDTPDALILSWGIVTAWIIAAAVLHLKRGVHL